MINSLELLLKDKDYFGFKLASIYRAIEHDSLQFTFTKEDYYFRIHLAYIYVKTMNNNQIINKIDEMINNSPAFKKLAHHKQFYNKFDEMLKSNG